MTNSTLIIGKHKFSRYLQVLPHHETVYSIEQGGIRAFAAQVGVSWEAAREKIRHHERRVNFEVWVDGKLRAQSGLMTTTDEPRLLVADGLDGAKEVKLVTRLDSNKDNPNFPAVWANPEFYLKR